MRTLLLESAIAVLLVTLASPVAAQQATSEIRGRVADQHGGVLPGVTIVLTNEDTGRSARRRPARTEATSRRSSCPLATASSQDSRAFDRTSGAGWC
jgi:hypothetical protein